MNKSRYIKMCSWFSNHKSAEKLLRIAYKYVPFVFILAIPAIIIVKGFQGIDKDFITLLVVPPCVFLGITFMRRLINRERPYSKYGVPSVIKKDRTDCSFPSRHTASAFIIAMSGYLVCIYLGIFLTVLAIIVALTRILAGVHYIFDVVFGMLFSILMGTVFYFII